MNPSVIVTMKINLKRTMAGCRRVRPERGSLSSRTKRKKSAGDYLRGEDGAKRMRTNSLERGEIPITLVTSPFTDSCPSASNFFCHTFCVLGIFLGILFTKNALQSVLQGISAEDEIPPAGGRRYLGAARGGPGNSLIYSRRA